MSRHVLESVHAMPERLQALLEAEATYDAALLLGGSNDLWTGDADRIWASLLQLVATLRAAGTPTLGLTTLPPFENQVMRWLAFTGVLEKTEATRLDVNARIRAEVAAAAAPNALLLVDLAALCEREPDGMARPDGMHFAASGYTRLGEVAAEALRPCLEPRKV